MTAQATASQTLHAIPYRRDIDGLRGVAVLLVLAFHLGLSKVHGGYVGVDVFFVISGYLITQVILRNLEAGVFTYREFYLRRARRIFPALFAMLLVCIAAALVLFPPTELRAFGGLLWKVATFTGNIGFARVPFTRGYFENIVRPSLLQHTWSLAVEEQFYLLYPLALVTIARWRRRMIVPALAILMLLSFGMGLWWTQHHRGGAYYLLPPRAWELLAGALLASVHGSVVRIRLVREAMTFAGLGMILAAAHRFGPLTAFPGYAAALPVAGAALLLWAGAGRSLVSAVLCNRAAVGTGLISYSLYLWHWPVLWLLRYVQCMPQALDLNPHEQAEIFCASTILAVASFFWVERPFRGAASPVSDVWVQRLAVTAIGATAAIGLGFVALHGVPQRFSPAIAARLEANSYRRFESPGSGECLNGRRPLRTPADVTFCRFGDHATNVMLWGDSHAWHMLPLLRQMESAGELDGRGVLTALAEGCPPSTSLNTTDPANHCDLVAKSAIERALQPDVDTVYLQFLPWWDLDGVLCLSTGGHCGRRLTSQETRAVMLADITAAIDLLKAHGKHVVLGTPFPMYTQDIPDVEIRLETLGRLAPHVHPHLLHNEWQSILRDLASREQIPVFDPTAVFCSADDCQYQVDGVAMLSDNNHVAPSQLKILHPALLAALNAGSPHPPKP